jgi:hypothetical protein
MPAEETSMSKQTISIKGYHLVPCDGSAHDPAVGGMIDNCWRCAPRWAEVLLPEQYASLDAWFAVSPGERETWNRKIALAHTRLRKAEYEARWARVSK